MTAIEDRPGSLAARQAMIDSQLRTSGVTEHFVLDRMRSVPREEFVPEHVRGVAYVDRAVPLGNNLFLAAPLFYGSLLAQARPDFTDRALVVDGGSGYLPALIEPLVASCRMISPEEAVSGTLGTEEYGLLLIDGAIEALPDGLSAALVEEGRVVTGLVQNGVTRLAAGRRIGGDVALLPLAEMGIPQLAAFDRPKGWSF